MRRELIVAALVLLGTALVAHAFQLTRDLWTGTEPFRVLVGHEMARSHDWIVPRLGGEVVLTKPPLYYWLVAAVEWLVGGIDRFWMRLPSVLALWLGAVAVFESLLRLCGTRTAWLGGLGVVLAPNLIWHGGYAEIDPVFAGLVAVSVVWLADGVCRSAVNLPAPRARLLGAGLFGALAMLTKGPPFLMFLIGPVAVWWRHSRLKGAGWYLVPMLLPPVAYYLVLTFASSVTPEEFAAVAAAESLGRVAHFGWDALVEMPLHPLKAWAIVLPFAIWLVPALRRGATPEAPTSVFTRTLAWSYVIAALVLLVFPRRPVRYLLPGVPLVVAATAPAIVAWLGLRRRPPRWPFRVVQGFGAAAAVGAAVVPWLAFPLPGRTFFALVAIAATGLLVRSRAGLLAAFLLIPVVLTATVLRDRQAKYTHGVRDEAFTAELLRRELDARGIDDFEFQGNPGESIAIQLAPDARWNDRSGRAPRTDWLVGRIYDGHTLAEDLRVDPDDWDVRARVRGRSRTYVLLERR